MKTRKLSGSVKRIIGLFSGIVVLLGAVFGVAIYNSLSNSETGIPVSVDSVTYDNNGNRIYLENPASVYKSHLGDYRLVDSNSKTYSLGDNTVIYDGGSLKILGGGYQVVSDTEISQLSNYSEIEEFNYAGFFKLADRKYLLIGNSIGGEGYPVSTDGYLFIVMDKTGNAMLLNDEVCEKTTAASAISVDGEYVFDIANEILTYGEDKFVDCSQIIGSTNEYDPDSDPMSIREKINSLKEQGRDVKNPDEVLIDAKGGTGGQGGNGGQGGDGGQGGAGGAGGPGGQGGTGVAPEVVNARKTANLLNITPSYTQATIEYYVNDPYGLLGDIFITYKDISNGGDPVKTTVDLDSRKMTIYNLNPSSKYEVVMSTSNTLEDYKYQESYQYFYTLDPEVFLTVTNVNEDAIICNVKFPAGLKITGAKAVLCGVDHVSEDDTKNAISTEDIIYSSAASSNGQTIIFTKDEDDKAIDFGTKDKYLAIYITDAHYGEETGHVINIPSRAYFTNAAAGKALWKTWSTNETYSKFMNYSLTKNENGEYLCCVLTGKTPDAISTLKSDLESAIKAYEDSTYDSNGRLSGFTDWDQKGIHDILVTIYNDYKNNGKW